MYIIGGIINSGFHSILFNILLIFYIYIKNYLKNHSIQKLD